MQDDWTSEQASRSHRLPQTYEDLRVVRWYELMDGGGVMTDWLLSKKHLAAKERRMMPLLSTPSSHFHQPARRALRCDAITVILQTDSCSSRPSAERVTG